MSTSANPLTPPTSDLSLQLLNKLFGAGWQNFAGNSSGFLQKILTVFDSALFSVLGVIAIYALVMGIAEASHDGVPLGRRYSKWMPFRLVFACSFLAPIVKGISIMQSIFLWVAGLGIGLADATWDKGTSYLITNGPAVVASQATGSTLAKDALQSLVCQYWVNQNYYFLTLGSQTGLPAADGSVGASLPAASGSFVTMTTTSGSYTVTNPSNTGYGPANFFGTNPGGTNTKTVSQGFSFDGTAASGLPPHICGNFTFSYSDSDPGASSIAAAQSAALKSMFSTLAPLAQAIVGNPTSTSSLAAMPPDPSPLRDSDRRCRMCRFFLKTHKNHCKSKQKHPFFHDFLLIVLCCDCRFLLKIRLRPVLHSMSPDRLKCPFFLHRRQVHHLCRLRQQFQRFWIVGKGM